MRKWNSILVLVALVAAVVALPVLAQAVDPAGDCPNARWELTGLDAVDDSVADKAVSKDAKGNGDGFVCQKQNKKGKFKVKDNTKLTVPETTEPSPGASGCPSGAWDLTGLDAVDDSVADKAVSKDAKGNGDGLVCQKQNKKGKFQVKDNNNPEGTDPEGTDPEGTDPEAAD